MPSSGLFNYSLDRICIRKFGADAVLIDLGTSREVVAHIANCSMAICMAEVLSNQYYVQLSGKLIDEQVCLGYEDPDFGWQYYPGCSPQEIQNYVGCL